MESNDDKDNLSSFQYCLNRCNNVVFLLGSGMATASGLQTFQNASSYWNGLHSIDIATPDAFLDDPRVVWQFYQWRRYNALKAKPNKAHYAVIEYIKRMKAQSQGNEINNKKKCLVVDLNVDGLLKKAIDIEDERIKKDIIDLHGNLFEVRCTDFFCNYKGAEDSSRDDCNFESIDNNNVLYEDTKIETNNDNYVKRNISIDSLPKCPRCSTLTRPDVVWFGESIPLKKIDHIDDYFINNHIDLIIVIGIDCSTWPAVGYVERVKQQGGKVAVFNDEISMGMVLQDKDFCWGFEGSITKTVPRALEEIIGRNFIARNKEVGKKNKII